MKKNINIMIVLGLAAFGSISAASHAPTSRTKRVMRSVWNLTKIGAGATTCAVGLPFWSISLLSMGIKPLQGQEPFMVQETLPGGKKADMGFAKELCDFIIFVESPENKDIPDFYNEKLYHPMFRTKEKISGIPWLPLISLNNDREKGVDTIVNIIKKGGLLIGAPFIVAGVMTMHSGFSGLKKEWKEIRETRKKATTESIPTPA